MPGLLGSAGNIPKRVRKAISLTEGLEEVMIPFLKRIYYAPTDPRNSLTTIELSFNSMRLLVGSWSL